MQDSDVRMRGCKWDGQRHEAWQKQPAQNAAAGSSGPRGPYRAAPPGPAPRGGREGSPGIGVVGVVGDSAVFGCEMPLPGEPDRESGEYPFPATLTSDAVDPSLSW